MHKCTRSKCSGFLIKSNNNVVVMVQEFEASVGGVEIEGRCALLYYECKSSHYNTALGGIQFETHIIHHVRPTSSMALQSAPAAIRN